MIVSESARAFSASANSNQVLVVEDDTGLREALCDTLELAGFVVSAVGDGVDALEKLEQATFGLVVSDIQMDRMDGLTLLSNIRTRRPELPVLLMTAYGTIQQAVDAMRVGAVDYLVKPFEAEVLASKVSNLLADPVQGSGASPVPDEPFICEDAASRAMYRLVERVAAKDVTVMITGESGTGKEVVARHLHRASPRADGPFVAVNCAAIPENMLEAMLFGYEKGAFTGAYRGSPGKFELAEQGTLLLDEVSEMALSLQAKLLRVLQEREVERLGAKSTIPLDVRVLATSNRNLSNDVAEGRFREDLFYRLNVFPVRLKPLRERRDDIVPLAKFFLVRCRGPSQLGEEAAAKLLSHRWPGNVRELDNVIQRAAILCDVDSVGVDDIVFEADGAADGGLSGIEQVDAAPDRDSLDANQRTNEHRIILDALDSCGGNRRKVAEKLEISERTLRYKLARMRQSGIEV